MSLRLQQYCAACAVCAALVLTLAACGSSVSDRHASARVVHVEERDFAIRAPHEVKAGTIRFLVKNKGPVSHELLLVRVPTGGLPMRRDGLTVDEDALGSRIIGVLEPDGPGSHRGFQARLAAGRYVFLCNMAGHYMSGMSSPLQVV